MPFFDYFFFIQPCHSFIISYSYLSSAHCTSVTLYRSVECVTEQQLLLIASSWGGVTLGIAFTLMQGGDGAGVHVYQAQVRSCCLFWRELTGSFLQTAMFNPY
jgi:hypothetical protein